MPSSSTPQRARRAARPAAGTASRCSSAGRAPSCDVRGSSVRGQQQVGDGGQRATREHAQPAAGERGAQQKSEERCLGNDGISATCAGKRAGIDGAAGDTATLICAACSTAPAQSSSAPAGVPRPSQPTRAKIAPASLLSCCLVPAARRSDVALATAPETPAGHVTRARPLAALSPSRLSPPTERGRPAHQRRLTMARRRVAQRLPLAAHAGHAQGCRPDERCLSRARPRHANAPEPLTRARRHTPRAPASCTWRRGSGLTSSWPSRSDPPAARMGRRQAFPALGLSGNLQRHAVMVHRRLSSLCNA